MALIAFPLLLYIVVQLVPKLTLIVYAALSFALTSLVPFTRLTPVIVVTIMAITISIDILFFNAFISLYSFQI